jgi:hypothetical protein
MRPVSIELTLLVLVLAILGAASWLAIAWVGAGDDPERRLRVRRRACAVGLGVAAFAVYLSNTGRLVQIDTQPAPFAALSLLLHGDLSLERFRPGIDPILAVTVTSPEGHIYSAYPPGSTLACVPFLLVPVWLGVPVGIGLIDFLAKLAAAAWTAVSVSLVFAALRRAGSPGAWAASLAYAFGTTAFSTASQDVWQHGPGQAGLALALYGIARQPVTAGCAALVGAGLGWAVVCRTPNLLPALVLGGFAALYSRRSAAGLAAGALPFAVLTLWHNHATTGSAFLFTLAHAVGQGDAAWSTPFATGFLGLLVAPSRGLLIYSPFLVLAIAAAAAELPALGRYLRQVWRRQAPPPPIPLAAVSGLAALAVVLLVSPWSQWTGGWSYGYRIISEAALLLTPGFAAALPRLAARRAGRALALALVLVSIAIHALQVYFPNDAWNAKNAGQVWSPRPSDTQIGWHLRFLGARLAGAAPRK